MKRYVFGYSVCSDRESLDGSNATFEVGETVSMFETDEEALAGMRRWNANYSPGGFPFKPRGYDVCWLKRVEEIDG